MLEITLIIQLIVFITVTCVFLATQQATIFHPASIYLVFHGLVFVLRPFLVRYLGFDAIWDYIGIEPTEEELTRTLLVTSVALVIFLVASVTFGHAPIRFDLNHQAKFASCHLRGLAITTFALLPLVLYSIYSTRSGISGERVGGIYILKGTTGYIIDAQHMAAPLLCSWLLVTRFHWANLLPILLYVCYRSWFGWSRWSILLFFLMVVLIFCWERRQRWPLARWAIVAVPLLILFNTLGHNRDYVKNLLVGTYKREVTNHAMVRAAEKWRQRLDTQDFANYDYLTYVLAVVPKRTDAWTYGLQWLQLFTEPIPRILWKSKPIGPPVRLFNLNAYGNFTGLTVSLPGDGWMNGGWAGLIITMALFGVILGRAHRWFWSRCRGGIPALIYLSGLAMLPQLYRDGGVSILKFLLFTLLPLFVWMGVNWWLDRKSTRLNSSHLGIS